VAKVQFFWWQIGGKSGGSFGGSLKIRGVFVFGVKMRVLLGFA